MCFIYLWLFFTYVCFPKIFPCIDVVHRHVTFSGHMICSCSKLPSPFCQSYPHIWWGIWAVSKLLLLQSCYEHLHTDGLPAHLPCRFGLFPWHLFPKVELLGQRICGFHFIRVYQLVLYNDWTSLLGGIVFWEKNRFVSRIPPSSTICYHLFRPWANFSLRLFLHL